MIATLLLLLIIKALQVLDPKKIAKYCIEDECITIVVQYHRVISGGNSQIRVYVKEVHTRYFLDFSSYAEFPVETHFLISKNLVDNKFIISSQSLPTIKGNLGNKVIFQEIDYYSEGDNKNIGSFNLKYRDF